MPSRMVHVHAQSCPTLGDAMDYSWPGCSVHGVSQARILEWAAMPSSRGSSQLRDRNCISYGSCIGRWTLLEWGPMLLASVQL